MSKQYSYNSELEVGELTVYGHVISEPKPVGDTSVAILFRGFDGKVSEVYLNRAKTTAIYDGIDAANLKAINGVYDNEDY